MPDLTKDQAKICITTHGWLVHEGKVLMVHHKKLDIWLAPGGHVDADELPHHAAEREMWEETGIKARAVDNVQIKGVETQFLPNPIWSNLHWVCRENYDVRVHGADPETVPPGWRKKGCEQHIAFAYLMEPTGSLDFHENVEETLGIGWFGLEDLDSLKTLEDIRLEVKQVLKMTEK